ncbi:MAG: gamma-glutamyltransferase family protein, partial [Synergistaceae bacterium]|nr:gamma-glutamyltransferase family protein [Synergistaceae bacterium]
MNQKGIRFMLVVLSLVVFVSSAFAQTPKDVFAKNGMVSAANELASKAGVEILKKGGNAVDAAVATALALNVVEFNASGIGGGGFMTIRFAKTGEVVALDYREMAPASATKDMFASEQSKKDKWSLDGGKAVAVPGWLTGMHYALEKYGTMTFAQVAAPAIRLAEEGFTLHPMQNGIIADDFERLSRFNDPERVPFFKDGLPLPAGAVLKQPKLGKLFRLIGEKGPKAFYEGEVADAIVAAVNKTGGKMTLNDLKNYRMEVRTPMIGTYRGYKLYSTPPASSGGAHIIQLMNILELFPMAEYGHNSPKAMHVFAEANKLIFADRAAFMADTAFVQVPLEGLISKAYAKTLAAKINPDKIMQEVLPGDPWKFQKEQKRARVGGMG